MFLYFLTFSFLFCITLHGECIGSTRKRAHKITIDIDQSRATFLDYHAFHGFYLIELAFCNPTCNLTRLDVPDCSATYHVNTINGFLVTTVTSTFCFLFGCTLCAFGSLLSLLRLLYLS